MNLLPTSPAQQFTSLASFYDELMDVVPYPAWAEYVALLFDIVGVRPATILDCACGTGNVSFELATLGYRVTGVDLSEAMIARAEEKLPEAASTPDLPRFLQADLTTFDLRENFDAATCLYDSFNYILEPAELARAFTRIAAHVPSQGVFVFDMNTPRAFETNLFTQRSRSSRSALQYDWKARYNPQTRICQVQMDFLRRTADGRTERFAEVHRERAYALHEVDELLQQTGWTLHKAYDAYTLNAPHDRSERWFFTALRQ